MNSAVRDIASSASIRLREIETVFQALSRLRGEADRERAVYFYVTDSDERLVGVVPSRRLLLAEPATLVAELMVYPVLSVHETETFGSALRVLAEHRLLALPVIDDGGKLTGVVDVSAVTRTLFTLERSQAADQIYQLAGVRPEPQRDEPFWHALALRYSILLSVAAGALAAYFLSLFGSMQSGPAVVAIFIPLVILFGGSVGMQTMTAAVRGLQPVRRRDGCVRREIGIGLSWSACAAAAVGLYLAVRLNRSGLAVVVACSLFTAGAAGVLLGCWTPRLLRRLRLHRTIASGPAVFALTTVTALVCYLAWWTALT